MTKERPIIFSGEMVKAILEGRKTQTRRVANQDFRMQKASRVTNGSSDGWFDFIFPNDTGMLRKCPYGQAGDRLWVRETWFPDPPYDDTWDGYMFDDGSGLVNMKALPEKFQKPEYVIYRASWNGVDLRWRPSIFMPRWASRITLEITGVRVERLQKITEEDCIAEGIQPYTFARGILSDCPPDKRWKFIELWNSINTKRGYPWESNPWIWVIEFKRVQS